MDTTSPSISKQWQMRLSWRRRRRLESSQEMLKRCLDIISEVSKSACCVFHSYRELVRSISYFLHHVNRREKCELMEVCRKVGNEYVVNILVTCQFSILACNTNALNISFFSWADENCMTSDAIGSCRISRTSGRKMGWCPRCLACETCLLTHQCQAVLGDHRCRACASATRCNPKDAS